VFKRCSTTESIPSERGPEHVRHPCFTLDIPNRRVFLGQMPGQQLTVELHAEELEQLLRRSRSFRSSASHHKGLEGECLRWLANETRRHNFPPEGRVKDDYQGEAQRKFLGLRKREFERAWKAAIEQTGATAWSKGGRRKRSQKT
jgi:hypothetical protein